MVLTAETVVNLANAALGIFMWTKSIQAARSKDWPAAFYWLVFGAFCMAIYVK